MAAVDCPKMMSSLLFYHKKENPLTGVIDSEGCGGLKRFCSELSSALRTTSLRVKLANPKVGAPRPRRKEENRGRGAEGGGMRTSPTLPCGESFPPSPLRERRHFLPGMPGR